MMIHVYFVYIQTSYKQYTVNGVAVLMLRLRLANWLQLIRYRTYDLHFNYPASRIRLGDNSLGFIDDKLEKFNNLEIIFGTQKI